MNACTQRRDSKWLENYAARSEFYRVVSALWFGVKIVFIFHVLGVERFAGTPANLSAAAITSWAFIHYAWHKVRQARYLSAKHLGVSEGPPST